MARARTSVSVAQQHCDYAARLEAGAAAHAAFVHDDDALHALLDEVEGGAEAGYAGPDYYDGLRSGGWHGIILWAAPAAAQEAGESTAEHAESAEEEGLG